MPAAPAGDERVDLRDCSDDAGQVCIDRGCQRVGGAWGGRPYEDEVVRRGSHRGTDDGAAVTDDPADELRIHLGVSLRGREDAEREVVTGLVGEHQAAGPF